MGLKFNCPNAKCRQRIEVEDALAGTEITCPACAAKVCVPHSHDIRYSCRTAGCGQHLLVDVSEAGRFVKCPSCGKPQRVPGNPPKMLVAEPKFGNPPASKPIFLSTESSESAARFKHEDQARQIFFTVSLITLLLLGLAKISSWSFKPWYPDGRDLILGLALNQFMPIIGITECLVAVLCAYVSAVRTVCIVFLWFSFNWWTYRIGQWYLGQKELLPTFGAWGESAGFSLAAPDYFMMVFVTLLLSGSSFFLWREWKST